MPGGNQVSERGDWRRSLQPDRPSGIETRENASSNDTPPDRIRSNCTNASGRNRSPPRQTVGSEAPERRMRIDRTSADIHGHAAAGDRTSPRAASSPAFLPPALSMSTPTAA